MHERHVSDPERDAKGPAEAVGLPPAETAAAALRGRLDAAGVLRLQRAIGNAAVGRLLARQPSGMPELLDPTKEWDQMMAEMAAVGEDTRKRMIDTLTGKDRILFMSRLRALTPTER